MKGLRVSSLLWQLAVPVIAIGCLVNAILSLVVPGQSYREGIRDVLEILAVHDLVGG
jgi:hypothetical protein